MHSRLRSYAYPNTGCSAAVLTNLGDHFAVEGTRPAVNLARECVRGAV